MDMVKLLQKQDVKEVVQDFIDNDIEGAQSVVLVFLDDKGRVVTLYAGISVFEVLGVLATATNDILREGKDDVDSVRG